MMHRIIRDHLEEVLTGLGSAPEHPAAKHLMDCEECREAVAALGEQAAILRQWRIAPGELAEIEPRSGFYARVLDRIEAQRGSAWTLFFDSLFARRIAMASLALALLLGAYVISSERISSPEIALVGGSAQSTLVSGQVSDLTGDLPVGDLIDYGQPRVVTGTPDQDAVLVNLVTYREQ